MSLKTRKSTTLLQLIVLLVALVCPFLAGQHSARAEEALDDALKITQEALSDTEQAWTVAPSADVDGTDGSYAITLGEPVDDLSDVTLTIDGNDVPLELTEDAALFDARWEQFADQAEETDESADTTEEVEAAESSEEAGTEVSADFDTLNLLVDARWQIAYYDLESNELTVRIPDGLSAPALTFHTHEDESATDDWTLAAAYRYQNAGAPLELTAEYTVEAQNADDEEESADADAGDAVTDSVPTIATYANDSTLPIDKQFDDLFSNVKLKDGTDTKLHEESPDIWNPPHSAASDEYLSGRFESADGTPLFSAEKFISAQPDENQYTIDLKVQGRSLRPAEIGPTDVVVVLDKSTSMTIRPHGGPKSRWQIATEAVNEFAKHYLDLDGGKGDNRIALLTYGTTVFDGQKYDFIGSNGKKQTQAGVGDFSSKDFTTKAQDIDILIKRNGNPPGPAGGERLRGLGLTNTQLALRKAGEFLDAKSDPSRRQIILLISDGEPTVALDDAGTLIGNGVDANKADYDKRIVPNTIAEANTLKNKGINVLSIGIELDDLKDYDQFGTPQGTNVRAQKAREVLNAITSGDNYRDVNDVNQLSDFLALIYHQIFSTVAFGTVTDPLSAEVELAGGKIDDIIGETYNAQKQQWDEDPVLTKRANDYFNIHVEGNRIVADSVTLGYHQRLTIRYTVNLKEPGAAQSKRVPLNDTVTIVPRPNVPPITVAWFNPSVGKPDEEAENPETPGEEMPPGDSDDNGETPPDGAEQSDQDKAPLPETGGEGILVYLVLGVALVLIAVFGYGTQRKGGD